MLLEIDLVSHPPPCKRGWIRSHRFSRRTLDHEVLHRLDCKGATAEPIFGKHYLPTVRVRLPMEHYACFPGLQQLEPIDEPPHPDVFECRLYQQPPFDPAALDSDAQFEPIAEIQIATLFAMPLYQMLVEADINESAPVRYCMKTNWKRFPPSRRRRMKSWQYAPEHTKLHYAPYKGKLWKVRPHPDKYRTNRLGKAIVCQEVKVFALQSANPEPLLKQLSDEWCARIAGKLRCRR